jgi:PBSX family phage terminase large subunit
MSQPGSIATTPAAGMSRKQILSFARATGRCNIFEGAVRSGKSFAWTWLMLTKIREAGTLGSIVLVGRSRLTVWRNVFEPLEQNPAFGMFRPFVEYKQGAPTATIFGRAVHIFGADDAASESSLRGMTVQLAFLDELTVLHKDFFKQLLARMSVPGAQLFATTNPDGPAHWLKADYLDKLDELPDWRRFHFVLDDNPSLDEAYKRSLRAEYTGLWYRRFILGLWVAAEGAVYDCWDEDQHVIAWKDLPRMVDILGVGVDYGTTNATAALMLGIGEDHKLYLIDEWRYNPRDDAARWTDSKLAEQLGEWINKPHLPDSHGHKHGSIIVDPAAASFRVQLREDGIYTHPAENDVLYGIRTTSSLLAAGKLLVTDRCKGFLTEVTGYSWDTKATEKGLDAPVKIADHSLDAARYVIATTERRWRRTIDLAA